MKEIVAERKLTCINREGHRFNVIIRIGKPYLITDLDWACPVEAEGLYKTLADQHGVDSIQALLLSIKLLKQLLRNIMENGGKILVFEDEMELNIQDLFEGI
jgi:hypothetical protein